PGRDDVVVEVGFRVRQQPGVEIKGRQCCDHPGGNRQDFAHEPADHGEQPRNQHDTDQDDVEESDRHDRVRKLRIVRTPAAESANEIAPTSPPPARSARAAAEWAQVIGVPGIIPLPRRRRPARKPTARALYSWRWPPRHPSSWPPYLLARRCPPAVP